MGRQAALLTAGAVVAAAVAGAASAFDLAKTQPEYARAALSPEDRQAGEQEGFERFQARRAAWIEEFERSGRDARPLPRKAILASYVPPQPTPAAAAVAATRIVTGRVESVRFTAAGTETVFRTNDGDAVGFTQNGGPEPAPNFVDGSVGYAENAPLLLPGDAAVLLLEAGDDGRTEIQSFTGWYAVHDGRVTAVEGNPFKDDVDGLSVERLLALFRNALGE